MGRERGSSAEKCRKTTIIEARAIEIATVLLEIFAFTMPSNLACVWLRPAKSAKTLIRPAAHQRLETELNCIDVRLRPAEARAADG
jgi:hypothetical protein